MNYANNSISEILWDNIQVTCRTMERGWTMYYNNQGSHFSLETSLLAPKNLGLFGLKDQFYPMTEKD